jgi:hypothetical protein
MRPETFAARITKMEKRLAERPMTRAKVKAMPTRATETPRRI